MQIEFYYQASYPAGQGQPSRIWKVQCDWLTMEKECCSRLSRLLGEGTKYELPWKHLHGRLDQNRGWHRAINLVLEMFADTVIECLVQLACGFPPGSKLMLRKIFQLAQPLFRQNLLMWKIIWLLVLNRVWQIIRCMLISGSKNREAALLKDVITREKRWQVTRLVFKPLW